MIPGGGPTIKELVQVPAAFGPKFWTTPLKSRRPRTATKVWLYGSVTVAPLNEADLMSVLEDAKLTVTLLPTVAVCLDNVMVQVGVAGT